MRDTIRKAERRMRQNMNPQLPIAGTRMAREEARDERIMRGLRRADEAPNEEWGTDESLNDGNSAFSNEPSNGKRPRGQALSD